METEGSGPAKRADGLGGQIATSSPACPPGWPLRFRDAARTPFPGPTHRQASRPAPGVAGPVRSALGSRGPRSPGARTGTLSRPSSPPSPHLAGALPDHREQRLERTACRPTGPPLLSQPPLSRKSVPGAWSRADCRRCLVREPDSWPSGRISMPVSCSLSGCFGLLSVWSGPSPVSRWLRRPLGLPAGPGDWWGSRSSLRVADLWGLAQAARRVRPCQGVAWGQLRHPELGAGVR